MLKPYAVVIRRTIETTVTVDAFNTLDAHRKIDAYGAVEAISDFPVRDETVTVKVISACLIKGGV